MLALTDNATEIVKPDGQDGATVYVDEAAAAMLDDMVLDGGVDGGVDEDGNIQFALGQQA